MFTAYMDESGDPAGKTGAFAVAGSLSTIQKWLRFEGQWKLVLRTHGVASGIFHMQECAAGAGDYADWSSEDRRELITSLSECFARHAKHAFSVTVVMEAWGHIKHEFQLVKHFGQPYAFCGRNAVSCVRDWMKQHKITAPIRYVFEDGMKGKGKGDLVAHMSDHDGITPDFEPKRMPPLQAADLIAWKNRRIVHDLVTRPNRMTQDQIRASLAPVSRIPHSYSVLDEKELLAFCQRHRVPRVPRLI